MTIMNKSTSAVNQSSQKVTNKTNLLAGEWDYMPGTKRHGSSLVASRTDLKIVEQDGTGGQDNPPINLYGTYLTKTGNFRISGTIEDRTGEARFQLYGKAPHIADEFRVEHQSLRIGISDKQLVVAVWDGATQKPAIKSAPCRTSSTTAFMIDYREGSAVVKAGGCASITVHTGTVFDTGNIWFGADADDSWELTSLTAEPLDGDSLHISNSASLVIKPAVNNALQSLATKKRSDFSIGAAMALGPAATDMQYTQVAFGGMFGSLTTENALKWQFVHPTPTSYSFQESDALVDLAKRHRMLVHGHALVFGEANPKWVQELPKPALKQAMTGHIKTVVGRYKGRIASWDVVNEPLADYEYFDADARRTLRGHIWFTAMGEAYIADAFRAAHAADPKAQLFINDYGLEEDGERWDAMLALVKTLKSAGVPVHGVGFQAHVYEPADRIDGATLRKHMRQLAQLGLKARVSEIDVYANGGSGTQAAQYAEVLAACLQEPNCTSYTTWGISDRYNLYKDDAGAITKGRDFLWDEHMMPTPAVHKLQELLQQ